MEGSHLPVACFAPPMSDELIARYDRIIAGLNPSPVKDAMQECMAAVKAWWALDVSTRKGTKHWIRHRGEDTKFTVTPLEEEHVKQLWDLVPWQYECVGMQQVFDTLPTGTREVTGYLDTAKGRSQTTRNEVVDPAAYELRNAAFHLLWHAMELTNDREPLTADKL